MSWFAVCIFQGFVSAVLAFMVSIIFLNSLLTSVSALESLAVPFAVAALSVVSWEITLDLAFL